MEIPCQIIQRERQRKLHTGDELDTRYEGASPNAISAIERMSDSEICRSILNETYTGKKSICLSRGDGCLKWSNERIGKESFIHELDRRYSGTQNCESINKRIKDLEKAPPKFVLIDSREPAYCTLLSFSDLKFLRDIEKIPRDQLVRMTLDFNQFKIDPGRYLDSCVIINQYKKYDYRKYFPKLLQKHKRTPFGLTWNGGLAFTWNDYRQAKNLHDDYKTNPQNYLEKSE